MQVEKLRLYGVLDNDKLSPLLRTTRMVAHWRLSIRELADFAKGFVVAHVDSGTCFDLSYKETAENILQIEIPYSLLPSLIAAQGDQPPLAERYRVPEKYLLKPERNVDSSQATTEPQPISAPELPQPKASALTPVMSAIRHYRSCLAMMLYTRIRCTGSQPTPLSS